MPGPNFLAIYLAAGCTEEFEAGAMMLVFVVLDKLSTELPRVALPAPLALLPPIVPNRLPVVP